MALALMGAGCVPKAEEPVPSPSSTPDASPVVGTSTITYYVSDTPEARNKFCNGAEMDSAGYKKTLTVKVDKDMNQLFSGEEKIKKTLEMAVTDTDFWNSPYTRVASTTFANGTVTMYPAGGFAGVSIFMCAWQPFVEKQLEQFPEIKEIKWEPVS